MHFALTCAEVLCVCGLFAGVSLIKLQNGLRAMLISDRAVIDADDSDVDDELTDRNRRQRRRRDATSDDNVMQVSAHRAHV